MNSLSHEKMREVLDTIMLHTTEQMANMQLKNENTCLSGNTCTVNAVFEGNCDLTLSLCADKSFLVRLTKGVLQEENVTDQDVEDTAKEYLNVICGRLIGQVFTLEHKPTSFRLPSFQTGQHIFNNNAEYSCEAYYINNYCEGALIVLAFSILPKEKTM